MEDVLDGPKPIILPEEVIGLILPNLEKADLLNCRLVCKSWNLECLSILNKSEWNLPLDEYSIGEYVEFLKSMETPQLVLPLSLTTKQGDDFMSDLEFLTSVFGEHCVQATYLWMWQEFDYPGNMAILAKVCRGLKELEIYAYERETGITPERVESLLSRDSVAFPNLKTFWGETSTQNTPTLFRTLMSTMSNLKTADLYDLDMTVVLDLLSNLESLESLKVWNFKPTLAFLRRIQEVKPRLREFNFYSLLVENEGDSVLFMDILNCLSLIPTLDKLGVAFSSKLSSKFQFPVFPHVKHLKFRNEVPAQVQNSNFNASTFPALEYLAVLIDTLQAEGAVDDDDEEDDEEEEANPPAAQTTRLSPILRTIISVVRCVACALKPTCIGQPTNLTSPDQDNEDRSDSLDTISLSAPTQNPAFLSLLKHLSIRTKNVRWTWNPTIFPALESLTLDFRFFHARQTIQFPTVRVLRVIFDGVSLCRLPDIPLPDQWLRRNLKGFRTMFPTLSKIIFENISDFETSGRNKVAPYFCSKFLQEFLLTVSGENLEEIQVSNDIDRDWNYLGDVIRQIESPPQHDLEGILTSDDIYDVENPSTLLKRNKGDNRVIAVFKDTERIRMTLRSLTRGNPGFPLHDENALDFSLIAKYFPNLRELDVPAYWFESLEASVRWKLILDIRAFFPGIVLNRVEPVTKNVVTV